MTRESREPGCGGEGPGAQAKNRGAGPVAVGSRSCLRVADFHGSFLRGTWRWAGDAQAESCHEPLTPGHQCWSSRLSPQPPWLG